MGRITYLRFAFSLFFRDTITSTVHVVFSLFFAYCVILGTYSVRIQKAPTDLSSIDLFRNSPYLVLIVSGAALVFMAIVKITGRASDTGIMMAVGGNRTGCVRLQLSELWILHTLGFLLAATVSILLPPGNPETVSILDTLYAYLLELTLLGTSGAIVAYIHTLVDPYRSIRSGK
ncbi:ABC transporter permease [Leptospira perolatii]|uniref:ABC transporter permease n=1 Tax=Leptospira perolatii TaxID=2023191 RepID=A0A2M9ZNI5_9LEPT|nr:ABC transporter permease [Leptospira perolatii]PJZ69649.1 ABC transporter permease [Leptospira perolatii]PJZ73636.1 ABC transporter permease [Leptospira perolatii]